MEPSESPRLSLADFTRQGWHVVEPATPYVHGWHLDAISDHLEAVTRGEIRNLIINIPPRHMKSLQVCVFWPCWEWTFQPHIRWLFSSYSDRLATRDSLKCRRLIMSPWYQQHWGSVFKMTGDQNEKTRFENSKTGYRAATGVGGAATGEGGDRIVVDDPLKALDADSDAVRETANTWWAETMSTRGNDPKTVAKVVVMQRLHEDDLTGHLLEAMKQGGERYEHLKLPAEYEPTTMITSIGWRDPRTKQGELLWPERFGQAEVDGLKVALGSHGAAGQLGQEPYARGGGMFQRGWFAIVKASPANARRVRYWDKAGTAGSGAYSAGVLMAYANGRFVIEDVVRGQWSAGQRETTIKQTAALDAARYGSVTIWQEQEPGSGGKESAENTVINLAGYDIHTERVTGDKVARARPFAAQAEAKNVDVLEGEWNKAFLDEAEGFPHKRFKDQIDAAGGALNKLALALPAPPPIAGGQRPVVAGYRPR